MMKDRFSGSARYVGGVETEDALRITANHQGAVAGWLLWRAGAAIVRSAKGLLRGNTGEKKWGRSRIGQGEPSEHDAGLTISFYLPDQELKEQGINTLSAVLC